MCKNRKNEAGFSAFEIVLVLVIGTLIGAASFMVYRNHNKKPATDAYAGWKTHCDNAGNCFKYPADWTAVMNGPTGAEAGNFSNPQQTLKLVSGTVNSDSALTSPALWYTSKLESPSTGNDTYRVWGGYLAATGVYVPQYAIVDASEANAGGLAVGLTESTTDDTYISYTVNGGSQHYSLNVFALSSNGFTKAAADSWFDSADATTALLVVRSFYNR